jgi:hypothetical protein
MEAIVAQFKSLRECLEGLIMIWTCAGVKKKNDTGVLLCKRLLSFHLTCFG